MSFSRKLEVGYLSFAQGLMTELSPLMTPEEFQGTTSDELNMEVQTEGMIRVRRNGVDYSNIPSTDVSPSDTKLELKYWSSANVYVVCMYVPQAVDGRYNTSVVLVDKTTGIKTRRYVCTVSVQDFSGASVAFLRNRCLVSFGGRSILITKEESGEYSFDLVDLHVRDFSLIPDGSSIAERPSTLTTEHEYNLINSTWYQNRAVLSTGLVSNPITNFFTVRGTYPSNADIAYLGDVTDSNGDLRFDPKTFDNLNLGSTEAPRGHYVYNIRDITRSTKIASRMNDGAPSNTLTRILNNGTDPVTGLSNYGGNTPLDGSYPELTPGVIIP